MTNEEAKTVLINCTTFIKDGFRFMKEEHQEQFKEAYRVALKALEKQIPKKPKYKTKINTVQGFQCEDIYVLCPSCDNRLYSIIDGEAVAGKKTNCCEKCGQALDWGSENGYKND